MDNFANTMIDRKNVRINEFVDKNDEMRKEEPKDYNKFFLCIRGCTWAAIENYQASTCITKVKDITS